MINTPEVFKSPNSDCYIVFGEAKIEDLTQQANAQAAAQMAAQEQQSSQSQVESSPSSGKKPEVEEEEGDVDETGVESKDIDLVMEQTSCSRGKAVKALKANNGDIVNAIMEVSTSTRTAGSYH